MMIIKNEFTKISGKIGANSVYLNPFYYNDIDSLISISPLLTNKTLLYITKNNLKTSLLPKIKSYVESGLIVPVSISSDTLPEEISPKKSILRTKLFDEKLFDKEYKESIIDDQEDDILKDMFVKTFKIQQRDQLNSYIDSFSFSSNWDIFFMQSLKVPIFSTTKYYPFIKHKLDNINLKLYQPLRNNHPILIKNFLEKINVTIPNNLDIDQINEFRKEKISVEFRNWLEKKLLGVNNLKDDLIVKSLIQEFNELSNKYQKYNNLISTTLGGFVGAITGTAIGGVAGAGIGAPFGSISGYGLSSLLKKLWKYNGPNNWVFLITDIKKNGSL